MIDLNNFTHDEVEIMEKLIDEEIHSKYKFLNTTIHNYIKSKTIKKIDELIVLKTKLMNLKDKVEDKPKSYKLHKEMIDKYKKQ